MKEKVVGRRKQQALETKSRIYRAALQQMDAKNYHSITIEDICKAAGVSVGAFYHYFKSKNDIFFEIYQEADHYFKENVATALQAPNGEERILEYFAYYADYCLKIGFDTVKSLYNTDNKLFVSYERFMLALLQQIITDAQHAHLLTNTQTALQITECLMIAARGVVFDWCLHDGQYDLQLKMQQYIKQLLPAFILIGA